MTAEDARILRAVQGILVRNYVDTQKTEVEVIGGSVYFEGEFRVFDYHPAMRKLDRVEREMSEARTLLHVEKQIRAMPEVAHIDMKFRNWERIGARWTPRRNAT